MTYHSSRGRGVGLMPTLLRLPTPVVVQPVKAPTVTPPATRPVVAPVINKPVTLPGPVFTPPTTIGPTVSPIINRVIQAQTQPPPVSVQPINVQPAPATLPGSNVPAQSYQTANQPAAPSAPPALGPTDGTAPPDNTMLILGVIGVTIAVLAFVGKNRR